VADRIAAAARAPQPPIDRVTLTYPVLNAARSVVLLVTGADKADAVARAFDARVPVAECPVRGVRPAGGSLTWHLDAAAASKLSTDSEGGSPT
jgi:6-phosphogluconolactonase